MTPPPEGEPSAAPPPPLPAESVIGVISDTHGYLNPVVFEIFKGVDMILHAGDVCGDEILTDLETIAPVFAVSGNVDPPPYEEPRPFERRLATVAGRIGMTHGHMGEAPSVDLRRMAKYFEDFNPDIIIYGHSHVARTDRIGDVILFNPGSAGPPRFGALPSVGLIRARDGEPPVVEHRHFEHRPRS